MMLLKVSALTLVLVSQVVAHGYVPHVKIGTDVLPGWDVGTGQCASSL